MKRSRLACVVVVGLVAVGCSSSPTSPSTSPTPASTVVPVTTAPPVTSTAEPTVPASFKVTAAFGQVVVTGAAPGERLSLRTEDGASTADATVDAQGALIFRGLKPGSYLVKGAGQPSPVSPVVAVPDDVEHPPASSYASQKLVAPGYGYLAVRDETTLSINISLPGPPEGGPYPTVVEYSGYDPSNPGNTTFAQLFTTLGYAYVGVNVRGTGCSGGSWKFFEPIESIDGYDVIETVAAQPWVKDNHVGMVGISYPGISQLFVARSRPPSLAAITPLSVLDDSIKGTLYPGGILNTGFAVEWTAERQKQAQPRGQKWTADRIDGGDATCAANQGLRLQNPDNLALIESTPFYDPAIGDELAPRLFVDQIDVPVFLAGAWQDEQTGGRFPTMISAFTKSPRVDVNLVNGYHTESLVSAPIFARYVEFLELYVAKRTPSLDRARLVYSILAKAISGVDAGPLPPDRFGAVDYAQALQTFEADPKVRIHLEEGAAAGRPSGSPDPRFTVTAEDWPVPSGVTRTFLLQSGGTMKDGTTFVSTGSTSYVADPTAMSATMTLPNGSGSVWLADNKQTWPPVPKANAATFVTPTFGADTLFAGSASADLWVKSSVPDTDIEVTLSEVRPDGFEMYIQSGWLRTSHRAITPDSTTTMPLHSYLKADAADLPAGEWSLARVEIFPSAHAIRAGSALKLTVSAPGGNRVQWAFRTIAKGETVEIAHDAEHRSQLVLVEVPGAKVPSGLPACGAVRNQPCRASVAP